MRVKALKSFGGATDSGRFHIPEGHEFELPDNVDWLRVGLVEPVKEAAETTAIEAPEKAARPKPRRNAAK